MKLLTLLKALQPEEYKEFEKFLASPFFRASEQYLAYFKYLCKHHTGFEASKAELEAAYRRCFGKDTYTDHKLYNLMSGMSRQVEAFMAFKTMMGDERLQQSLLVRAMGQRKMGTYYRNAAENYADALEAQAVKGKDDYLLMEQLYYDLYFNPDTAKHKPYLPHLQKGMEQLDLYYSMSKLRYAAAFLNRGRLFNEQHHIPMLDMVLKGTEQADPMGSNPTPALYHKLVRLYLEGVSEADFRDLQAKFMQHHGPLHETDQAFILMHLINCGISLGRADVEVNHEMLALYKLAISTGALLENNGITHSTFCNIVILAVLCHEPDWAAWFMEQFSFHLADNIKEPTILVSTAYIYHAKGELDKAQDCLVQEVFTLPPFDLLARALLLKILFERYIKDGRDYEFLIGQLNAYEKYIGIKQLSAERKKANLNAIRFVRKMTNLKLKHRELPAREKELLIAKLSSTSPITMKDWIRSKIEEL